VGLEVRILASGTRWVRVEILKGVNAGFPEGEITCVVGPSGAGKSTLLRAVNRLIEPTAGEVYLDGSPTSGMDPLLLRRRVGMVFQLPALFGASVETRSSTGRAWPKRTPTRSGCWRWWGWILPSGERTRRLSPLGNSSGSR
jgi:ABC-type cobalamin/Fe3+-siderophores transport system ATPase subunit